MSFYSQLHVTYAWICCCCPFPASPPQGMMGAYGHPYMPMQGPHEGLLGMGPMPPHHMAPHHLPPGMPGYPGMPHPGKDPRPSHTCSVVSSRVSLLLEGFTWSTGCGVPLTAHPGSKVWSVYQVVKRSISQRLCSALTFKFYPLLSAPRSHCCCFSLESISPHSVELTHKHLLHVKIWITNLLTFFWKQTIFCVLFILLQHVSTAQPHNFLPTMNLLCSNYNS